MLVKPQEVVPLEKLSKRDMTAIMVALAIRYIIRKYNPNSLISSTQLQEEFKQIFPDLSISAIMIRSSLSRLGIRASYFKIGYEVGTLIEGIDNAIKAKYYPLFEPLLFIFRKIKDEKQGGKE